MKVRCLELEDLKTLHKWWAANRFPCLNYDDLPMVNGELQGLIVYKDNIEFCAGFLIDTTVKNGAMIEYIVANFDVKDRLIRNKSQLLLINSLNNLAKAMGKKYTYTSVKNQGLINKFLDTGFQKGSLNATEMIKQL
jgi:hypothetical protein